MVPFYVPLDKLLKTYKEVKTHLLSWLTPLSVNVDVGCEKWTWCQIVIMMLFACGLCWNDVYKSVYCTKI
jgi:hypothetical protein